MVILRNFTEEDAGELQQNQYEHKTLSEVQEMIREMNKKIYKDKYFEMFAIVNGEQIVGSISLYQHSETVVSCGPEIFECYRRRGFAREAMMLAMNIAKSKGYKIVLQQIRIDNVASIALHNRLGFETDGYVYKNKKGNEVLIYLKLCENGI